MSNIITTLKVPQITTNFGKVNKVIWFNVSDVDGTYSMNLHITPSQVADTLITIINRGNNNQIFSKTYPKSSNSSIINETIKIRHTPGLKSPIYGLKSI